MIYISGDCHEEYQRFSVDSFPEQKRMGKEDYVIICGDFGLWKQSKSTEYWMKWLTEKPFTTLWVDGNHENFDLLKEYPAEEWKGGKVQFITDSVIHLMRGQIYELEGKRIFTFGGAKSHDMPGGVLDRTDPEFERKRSRLKQKKIRFRINHESWWQEELPSEAEMKEGLQNLERCGWQVDWIITHCCAASMQESLGKGGYGPDRLTDYLEEIRRKCRYERWFFGHYHEDRAISEREWVLYEQIVRVL